MVRAIQPFEGIERMEKNRGVKQVVRLASGPGNLTRALRIDRSLNGEDMISSRRLWIETGRKIRKIGVSSRVGIRADASFRWRFYSRENPFVSRGKPSG